MCSSQGASRRAVTSTSAPGTHYGELKAPLRDPRTLFLEAFMTESKRQAAPTGLVVTGGIPMAFLSGRVRAGEPTQADALGVSCYAAGSHFYSKSRFCWPR